jgi:glycine cleavage system H protein
MSEFPTELRYAKSHEWARLEEDGTVTVGISDHAQGALGDVVYVELPELDVVVEGGEEAGVVESVKAASDIYAPIGGTIIASTSLIQTYGAFANLPVTGASSFATDFGR